MIIVNRETFLKLPENTLFAKYLPCAFGPLCIKNKTIGTIDFISTELNNLDWDDCAEFDAVCANAEKGESAELDLECGTRDGMFEASQLFAIYEAVDISQMIAKLHQCYVVCMQE